MGLLDKAKGLLGQHADKVEGAIDKVADAVDEKTGGKYTDQIDKGAEAAKDLVGEDEGQPAADPPSSPAV
jgi:ABC-type transporter Mla subunit MlaD